MVGGSSLDTELIGCLEGLRRLEDESVDLITTDPPYGISFMGKDWDKALPDIKIWQECLRVLKSGAFAFVMSIPRADCMSRMVISLEEAGFRVNFTPIYWCYASGFPKAQNIAKAVDKRPRRLELTENIGKIIKEHRIKKRLNLRQLGEVCNEPLWKIGGTVFFETESTQRLPTKEQWQKLKNALDISNEYDELFEEAEREIIGKDGRTAKESCFGIGIQKEWDITKSASPQAKALDGSYGGFQPKPAVEVIIVAMKPLSEKTFVDQALKNQRGITWLDEGMIPYENEGDKDGARFGTQMDIRGGNLKTPIGIKAKNVLSSQSGRFPANLLVSDDVLNDGRVHKSGDLTGQYGTRGNVYGVYKKDKPLYLKGNSVSSFSRYFDLDKWWEERIKQLPDSVQKTFPFLIVPKASKGEKNKGLGERHLEKVNDGRKTPIDNPFQRGETPRKNIHPSVKPVKLMSYLITLGSREGGVVLDPFMGSGTTGEACKILNRHFIGFENNEGYFTIADSRLGSATQPIMPLKF